MSVWTHVAGVIRADAFRFEDDPKPDWNELIGHPYLWGSMREDGDYLMSHPEQWMPSGSEGSLQYSVWENPNMSHITAYVISVFGDLRDYDDTDAIVEWFKKVCSRLWVRNAVIEADCGDGSPQVWSYTRDGGEEDDADEDDGEDDDT